MGGVMCNPNFYLIWKLKPLVLNPFFKYTRNNANILLDLFFIDEAADIRATRRHLELKDRGEDIEFSEVLADIIKRDCRDKNRTVAPLIAAEDAFFIDSSDKNAEEVLVICLDYLDGAHEPQAATGLWN